MALFRSSAWKLGYDGIKAFEPAVKAEKMNKKYIVIILCITVNN